jgi:hypothetical protein
MAHAQKPDFVFRRNGRVHLNRHGRQFSPLLAAEVCASAVSNAGYTMFRGSVKSTGYPLHSPVSPSLPLPCVTMCHHVSAGLYNTTRHKITEKSTSVLIIQFRNFVVLLRSVCRYLASCVSWRPIGHLFKDLDSSLNTRKHQLMQQS